MKVFSTMQTTKLDSIVDFLRAYESAVDSYTNILEFIYLSALLIDRGQHTMVLNVDRKVFTIT